MLAEHPRLEPEPRRVAHPRPPQLDTAVRRAHRLRLIAIAMRHRLAGALVAAAAEELGHLLLERLLQDQPRSEAANHLHRILLLADTGQRFIELSAKPLARGYLLHAGVPPSASTCRSKRRLRPPHQFPRILRRDHDFAALAARRRTGFASIPSSYPKAGRVSGVL